MWNRIYGKPILKPVECSQNQNQVSTLEWVSTALYGQKKCLSVDFKTEKEMEK